MGDPVLFWAGMRAYTKEAPGIRQGQFKGRKPFHLQTTGSIFFAGYLKVIYIYKHTHTYVYICIYTVYIYIYIYVCMCTHTYIYTKTHAYK